MATSASSNARLIKDIKKALPDVSDHFEADKLRYVAKALTPAAIEKRDEWDKDVRHLHEVASRIISRFTGKELTPDE